MMLKKYLTFSTIYTFLYHFTKTIVLQNMYHLSYIILILIFTLHISSIYLLKNSYIITNITCISLNTNYLKYTKCELNHNTTNHITTINIYGKLMVKRLDKIMVINLFLVYL